MPSDKMPSWSPGAPRKKIRPPRGGTASFTDEKELCTAARPSRLFSTLLSALSLLKSKVEMSSQLTTGRRPGGSQQTRSGRRGCRCDDKPSDSSSHSCASSHHARHGSNRFQGPQDLHYSVHMSTKELSFRQPNLACYNHSIHQYI